VAEVVSKVAEVAEVAEVSELSAVAEIGDDGGGTKATGLMHTARRAGSGRVTRPRLLMA
jgi:hypothetical protein